MRSRGVRLVALLACVASTRGDAQEPLVVAADAGGVRLVSRDGTLRGPVVASTDAPRNPRLLRAGAREALALWESGGRRYAAATSDSGATWSAPRARPDLLRLRRGAFDPTRGALPAPPAFAARADDPLRLVQFVGPAPAAVRAALAAAGVVVLAYVPGDGALVSTTPEGLVHLASSPFVRAVAPYAPADRAPPEDLAGFVGGGEFPTVPRRLLLVRAGDLALKRRVAEDLARFGAFAIFPPAAAGACLDLVLPPEAWAAATRHDAVLYVDRLDPPEPAMDVARAVLGAAAVAFPPPAGFFGAGVGGQVLDFVPRATHADFPNIQWHGETSVPTLHGTAVTGIVFGRGTTNPAATGMLPEGRPIGGYAAAPSVAADRYGYTAALLSPPFEACFQSNSWGTATTTSYTNASRALDEIAFDLDLPIFQAQGNFGGPVARAEAWAKNVISVGGVHHQNTADVSDDAWAGGASTGPAEDGRLKPDLVAFFDQVLTTSNLSDVAYEPNFTGTSAATPMVAGAGGLLVEMWARGVFGPRPLGPSLFARRPRAATVKALLVASARPYAFTGTGGDLARVRQGYGIPDVARAHAFGLAGKALVVDETAPLAPFAAWERTTLVVAGEPELRAVLTWSDPPALPSATAQRVNDLDLEATSPSGVVYRGGVGLDVGPWSAAGGAANAVDTTECVFVPLPEAGLWTVRVVAAEINLDGRPETPALDADFALVVFGGVPTPLPSGPGSANDVDAWLLVNQGASAALLPPAAGVAGPFFATASPGGPLVMHFGGAPQAPFALVFGPLRANNLVLPGYGSLDVGALGPASLADVTVLLNGFVPATPLDLLANVGASGIRTFGFTLPAFPPGPLGALQAAVVVDAWPGFKLTAAFALDVE